MRIRLSSTVAACSLSLAVSAFAQSAATAPVTNDNPAAAVPVALGKRLACRTAAQGKQGQDRQDQMQLCMAQARLDCLKQAIDQKIIGPQRKDYIENCVEQ